MDSYVEYIQSAFFAHTNNIFYRCTRYIPHSSGTMRTKQREHRPRRMKYIIFAFRYFSRPYTMRTSRTTMKCRSDQTLRRFLVDIATLSMDEHFPLRLYAFLEYVSRCEHGLAIHWTHNGEAFVVSQPDVIVEHVLPVFFNLTNIRSFVSSYLIFLTSVPS